MQKVLRFFRALTLIFAPAVCGSDDTAADTTAAPHCNLL